jgi:tryptophan halogenase
VTSVTCFEQHPETGCISKLRTQEGQEIAGDFFLDCTGLRRLLFAPAYRPKWKSYAEHVRVDSAIPCFAPFAANELVPTYTAAVAMPHGWMWQIPTQQRMGTGYIYSSKYISDEQAKAEFLAAGVDAGENPRILRFDPGRFEQQWQGNVCTVGLSGGFIEPLEASTIHGMYVQIRLLTELFLPFATAASLPVMAAQYNGLIASAYDDYVDFITFHYHTGRADTDFWRDYQQPRAITPANQARMDQWQTMFPKREDFIPIGTQQAGLNTGLVIWAPMLCGMGYLHADLARRQVELSRYPQMLRENVARYIQTRDRITATALTQTEAIEHFCQQRS